MILDKPITVLLTTEGTYPFYGGGVSSWCDQLARGLPEIDFLVQAIVTNPYPQSKYVIPSNVREVIKVPQWGLFQPAEFSHHQPTSAFLHDLWETTPSGITTQFKPVFERFLALLFSSQSEKTELGDVLLQMQIYFQRYDYAKTMNSIETWDVLQHAVHASWECRPAEAENPTLAELKEAYRVLYYLLMVLHFPIPKADIAHSSSAGLCGLPCVFAKLVYGTPYLLTEHGVYLREQYLNLRREMDSFFVRWFLSRLVEKIVELNYHFADQISPVCSFNSRWERKLGVSSGRIKVIFNGADPERFSVIPRKDNARPVVSSIGLIFPLKGQLDLIGAAALLKESFQDIEIRFYGGPSDLRYFEECQRKVNELRLAGVVKFAGATREPWKAYNDADVVAFPSISEGFPFAVLEAMFCGAAIVATDVGGIAEALGECGLLVPARSPKAMAEAIAFMLNDASMRKRLGSMARERALAHFTKERFLASYASTYRELLLCRTQRFVSA